MASTCVFCKESVTDEKPIVTLGAKGCESILRASESRQSDITVNPGDIVHIKCRREYINPHVISAYKRKQAGSLPRKDDPKSALRSTETPFDYKTDCLFCGCSDPYDGRKQEWKLIPVRSMDFSAKVLTACDSFTNDWVDTVRARVLYAIDLPAADAVYHQLCSVNFRTGKHVPQIFVPKDGPRASKYTRMSGRPKDVIRNEAFLKVADYLEQNDDEQITVNDLVEKMKEYTEPEECECDPYSSKYMKSKIKQHFGDKIVFTEINGKPNVVTFVSTAARILQDFHYQQKHRVLDETIHIIETAAKLIKQDIKDVKQSNDTYPTYSEISSAEEGMDYLPKSLQTFLSTLFVGQHNEPKLASIGQAIMQATRPRVLLVPLQVGLGVQLHHHFQSKFLIDTLHRHGFCLSYSEVKKFERSAAMMQGTDIQNCTPEHFLQYAADNVDHNIRTIDGKNTFHGMGIIVGITPKTTTTKPVRRINVTNEDIKAVGGINIEHFTYNRNMESMHYEHLTNPDLEKPYAKLDLLWEASLMLKTATPLWSGLMQMVYKGEHPGESSVMFLPMIDMDPNDLSCIYSTLKFVCLHAARYNSTPIITFDQPLWWKANMIVESEPETSPLNSVVVRLGGFHIEMSFLGCIGHLMGGSGLREVLQVIYADNAVGHILSGKAVSRAVRGHLLVDAGLNALLIAQALSLDIPTDESTQEPSTSRDTMSVGDQPCDSNSAGISREEQSEQDEMSMLTELMKHLLTGSIPASEVETDEVLVRFEDTIASKKENLQSLRTSKLWLQYLDMIKLLRGFLTGERTGNWALHLQSLYDMLPYFAASGHNLYLKSIHLYLQKMSRLSEQHPEVYRHFLEGLHVIRRSERSWAGFSTDLIIEQCLMRSIKTTGGLTRGRGLTEAQRVIWVLSTPMCAAVNIAMQEFTNIQYTTSEQHKDATSARMKRDRHDCQAILQYLSQRNPFSSESPLRNIATGVLAGSAVDACDAKMVGQAIIKSMEGHAVASHSLKKKKGPGHHNGCQTNCQETRR